MLGSTISESHLDTSDNLNFDLEPTASEQKNIENWIWENYWTIRNKEVTQKKLFWDEKNLMEKIEVNELKQSFKLSTDAFQIWTNKYRVNTSVQGFAKRYGYTKNTTTLKGVVMPAIYGKFQVIDINELLSHKDDFL